MRLTTGELTELPLAAQWLDAHGNVIARTPEWAGGGIDTAQFRCGALQMIVATAARDETVAVLSGRVLEEVDALVDGRDGALQLHRRALRAALQLVMGTPDLTERSAGEVLGMLRASAREDNVEIAVELGGPRLVRGGDTLAIALKQLASNAAKHDGAAAMTARAGDDGVFRIQWNGSRSTSLVHTSRHPDQRERWGLGLVRLAADALGASVLPVRHRPDGRSEAAIQVLTDAPQLTLPLAAIHDDGRVDRATRAWDEETGAPPGRSLSAPLAQLAAAARRAPGAVVSDGAYVARRGLRCTWIAVRPRSHRDQARDLIAGIAHEKALVGDGQDGTRLVGSTAALSLALGCPTEMWVRAAAEEQLPAACSAFGVGLPSIEGTAPSLPPPALMAFLTAEGAGGEFVDVDGAWVFRPRTTTAVLADLTREGVLSVA
jgi:hypothetical protein